MFCRACSASREGPQCSIPGLSAWTAVQLPEQDSLFGSEVPGVQPGRHVLRLPWPRRRQWHDASQVRHLLNLPCMLPMA